MTSRADGMRRRSAGFTLMEVLVALVVLGMLFVALTQGARLGLAAWNTQSRTVALRDQLDDTDRALRLLMTNIESSVDSDAGSTVGAADHFQFRTRLPSAVSLITRSADVTLELDNTKHLVLTWIPHLHEQTLGPAPKPNRTELLSNVAKLDFHYWQSSADNGQTVGWQTEWNAQNPPRLIKLHIAFAKGDPRHWPDIVVAPAIDAQVE